MRKKTLSPAALFEMGISTREWGPVIEAFDRMFGFTPDIVVEPAAEHSEELKTLTAKLYKLVHGDSSAGEESVAEEPAKPTKKRVIKKVVKKAAPAKRRPASPPAEEDDDEYLDEDEVEDDEDDDPEDDDEFAPKRRRLPDGVNRFAGMKDGAGDGDVRCQSAPYQKPRGPNAFVDDHSMNADLIEETKKMVKKAKPKTYRDSPLMVTKRCAGCHKKEKVPPALVLRDGTYRCNSCARGGAGSSI